MAGYTSSLNGDGGSVLFTNVRILDATGEQPYSGEVLVQGNRIKQITRGSSRFSQPMTSSGATVIDGMGATLMPGMIDAHLHLSWNNAPGIDPIQMMELEDVRVEPTAAVGTAPAEAFDFLARVRQHDEPVRQRGIPCEQLGRGKTMPLRLQDMMVVDRAELADGTVHRRDEIGIGQRPYARFQRPPEKVVERGVAGDVRVFGLAHVDTVFPDEPADQPGRRPSSVRPRDATGKLGEPTFGQKVLRQDRQATEHHDL